MDDDEQHEVSEDDVDFALALIDAGLDNEAIVILRRLAARGSREALVPLGNLLADAGQTAEAEDVLGVAIARGDENGRVNLANLYAESGRPDQAEMEYLKAIDKGDTLAQHAYGIFLASQGRLDDARKALELAVALGCHADFDLGNVLTAMSLWREAADAFVTAAADGDGRSFLNLANILADHLGDTIGAEQQYRNAIGAGDRLAHRNLGDLMRSEGRRSDAERAYREAIRQGDTDAHLQLALLYEDVGDADSAEIEFRRALEAGDELAEQHYRSFLSRKDRL